jgi:predicted nucleic acid-binding protein
VIVLDTTVLLYAIGGEHPLRAPCRGILEAVTDGRVEATTTVEAIQEFAHVRARRQGRAEAVARAHDYVDLLSPLLTVDRAELEHGLDLFAATDRLGVFDAVLAAAAHSVQAEALVSADRAFAALPQPSHVFPDADGVRGLLGPGR